jgi:DNA-binding winged helix-turn-helix (wHTH) protein/TolB-like protein
MSEIYEFSNFRLDIRERILERISDGERVALPEKAFDTLSVLVRNAGRLVAKDEILNEVWADSFVEENNLNKSIHAIRRALGENRDQKFIETVKKYGFRFTTEVRLLPIPPAHPATNFSTGGNMAGSILEFPHLAPRSDVRSGGPALAIAASPELAVEDAAVEPAVDQIESLSAVSELAGSDRKRSSLYPAVIAAVCIAVVVAGVVIYRYAAVGGVDGAPTLAVLPLKPLDANDNYLGIGLADAIIRRLSQSGTLTVRPTSAVRRYLNEDSDALTAARELGVDVVLEGTVQRADDRLRVSVNLLRTSDGRSLWADNFDMRSSDVFAIQDKVSQQVARSLQLRLDPAQRERFATRYTPNAFAYEYYLKGIYSFDQRGFNLESKPQHEITISLFKKSIEADPNYALAHAQLAYAYAWMGLYIDENAQAEWVERAKEEISRANALDPQLAETHVARHHILLSAYEGFKLEEATREILVAKQLNPNAGGLELAVAYNHLGLEDMFDRETQRTLEIDPTSEFNKRIFGYQYLYTKRYDDWLSYRRKYFDGKLNIQYLLGTGRLAEAEQLLKQIQPGNPDDQGPFRAFGAMLSAVKGNPQVAEAAIPAMLSKLQHKNRDYHHQTYEIACIYAMVGKSVEAVKWLRETASTGFPSYPLFERDHYLDRIRQAPEFVQFMDEMRSQNERARREFEQ